MPGQNVYREALEVSSVQLIKVAWLIGYYSIDSGRMYLWLEVEVAV